MSKNKIVFVKNTTEFVYELLKRGEVLTTKKALAEYDIGRLANHIDELRKRGVSINRTRVNHHNGKGKHHYEFTLAKEQEQ